MDNDLELLPAIATHDLAAEQALLGAMLSHPGVVVEVCEHLHAADFYRETHRTVYASILTLFARGEESDPITVAEELRLSGQLDEVGGIEFLFSLTEFCPASSQGPHYSRIVEEHATRRALAGAALTINDLAVGGTLSDLTDEAERLVFEATQRSGGAHMESIGRVMAENYARIEALRDGEHRPGTATGFKCIDRVTGGFFPDNLCVLAGRPGNGKSSLALAIAVHIAKQGKPVAFFSMEMSAIDIADRNAAMLGQVPLNKFRCGGLTADEHAAVVKVTGEMEGVPLWIDETAVLTPTHLRSASRRLAMRAPLGLVVVDYLQLMTGGAGMRRNDNRQQEVSDISRQLKALARELKCPVLALSQLNRNSEMRGDKRPELPDLRESGAIEQDADLVMFLHHDKDAEERVFELIIAKQRNGPTSLETLAFQKQYTRFIDIDFSDHRFD